MVPVRLDPGMNELPESFSQLIIVIPVADNEALPDS